MSDQVEGEASGSILIVEDNETLAGGLRANFEVEGYDVEVASNGEDALDRLARATPDIVILDLALPGISGFDVLRKLRGAGSEVPVLFFRRATRKWTRFRGSGSAPMTMSSSPLAHSS